MFQAAPFSTHAGPKRAALGQTEQQWYARAKAAVAKFDELETRVRRLASPVVRSEIYSEFVGEASDSESALYRRNSVAYNVSQAESYTPINYMVFAAQQQSRVEKLEEMVRQLNTEVTAAEGISGILPDPVIMERVVERPAAPVARDLTLPILAGAVALAVLGYLVLGD